MSRSCTTIMYETFPLALLLCLSSVTTLRSPQELFESGGRGCARASVLWLQGMWVPGGPYPFFGFQKFVSRVRKTSGRKVIGQLMVTLFHSLQGKSFTLVERCKRLPIL